MAKFRITQRHLTIVLIALAAILVVAGLVCEIFKFDGATAAFRVGSNVIIVVALVIYVYSRKLDKDASRAAERERKEREAAEGAPPTLECAASGEKDSDGASDA